jgi:hypothetical protein
VDSLSHILAWASEPGGLPGVIDCPRLRCRFAPTFSDGGDGAAPRLLRLSVLDHGGLHVLLADPEDLSDPVDPALLRAVPRCLVLSDNSRAVSLLVPNYPLLRPTVTFCPFTTAATPQAGDGWWQSACDARFFLYEVHASNAFVLFESVGSTLYWAFCKVWYGMVRYLPDMLVPQPNQPPSPGPRGFSPTLCLPSPPFALLCLQAAGPRV